MKKFLIAVIFLLLAIPLEERWLKAGRVAVPFTGRCPQCGRADGRVAVSYAVGHGSYVDTIIPGKWNIDGQGYGEKEFVRLELGLEGNMNLRTQKVEEIDEEITELLMGTEKVTRVLVDKDFKALTSYDVNLKLTLTGAEIKVLSEHIPNGIKIPAVLPEIEPTVNDPFVLPTITQDKISYTLRFTSNSSGVLRVHGYVDVDVVGECEIKADCRVWRDGAQAPEFSSGTSSGCNSGIRLEFFALVLILLRKFGGRKFVWN